ncbi:MAG: thymidylate kinase [Acidobacteria bacterium]|nr:thymidylate kinase [Acidobacteriota bacterium]MBI3657257.1 thymidylate kinase [Acidobacteriota bacterium]
MGKFEYYGKGLPGIDLYELKGHLIVLEGTDGVGRSTQVGLLRSWLESRGHAVLDTGMARSALAGKGIKKAKRGHTLGGVTQNLFYATDFADRLENEMIPALRAGFVVLTDRYIYSLMARAIVRGANPEWIKDVYNFALQPDAIFYLRIGIDDLIPRVLHSSGFDYWESGMDMRLGDNLFTSFSKYQSRLLSEFDAMVSSYGFQVIDAAKTIEEIFAVLRDRIAQIVEPSPARPLNPPLDPSPPESDKKRA